MASATPSTWWTASWPTVCAASPDRGAGCPRGFPAALNAAWAEPAGARSFQCLGLRADRNRSVVLRESCATSGRRRMTSAAAIAGPLEPGAQVGLQLPQAGTCAAQVASCDGRVVILELTDELPAG